MYVLELVNSDTQKVVYRRLTRFHCVHAFYTERVNVPDGHYIKTYMLCEVGK